MKYTNKQNLPKTFVEALSWSNYDVKGNDPTIISVTTLINPPIIRQLRMRHWDDITEDVADGIWRLLGSAVHEIMSRVGQHNRLIEERMTEPVLGMRVTGKPDIYDEETFSIQDYKVTSVWTIKYDPTKWEEQLNTYAWFIRKLGLEVKEIFVNAILRDWSASMLKKSRGEYPPFAYQRIPIRLWSFEEQQAFIEKKIKEHQLVVGMTDDVLPVCSEEDRWKDDIRCKQYCNVMPFCPHGNKYNV